MPNGAHTAAPTPALYNFGATSGGTMANAAASWPTGWVPYQNLPPRRCCREDLRGHRHERRH